MSATSSSTETSEIHCPPRRAHASACASASARRYCGRRLRSADRLMSSRRMISLFMLRFSAAACSRSRARSCSGMFLMVREATSHGRARRMEPLWFHMRLESILVVCGGPPADGGARESGLVPTTAGRISGSSEVRTDTAMQFVAMAGRLAPGPAVLHTSCPVPGNEVPLAAMVCRLRRNRNRKKRDVEHSAIAVLLHRAANGAHPSPRDHQPLSPDSFRFEWNRGRGGNP